MLCSADFVINQVTVDVEGLLPDALICATGPAIYPCAGMTCPDYCGFRTARSPLSVLQIARAVLSPACLRPLGLTPQQLEVLSTGSGGSDSYS